MKVNAPTVWFALLLWVNGLQLAAAEPQVAFVLKNGWVECKLRQDGQPVAGSLFEVMDDQGKNVATGETDAAGEAAFPVPRGASFVVEIKAGERIADPIRLYRSDAGVEPGRVLLSYGLRSCCRLKERTELVIVGRETVPVEAPNDMPPWWGMVAAAGFVSLVTVCIRVFRQGANHGNTQRAT